MAALRHSLFGGTERRIVYVGNYMIELVKFFQSPALSAFVMSDRVLYKEFVPILLKVQNTF